MTGSLKKMLLVVVGVALPSPLMADNFSASNLLGRAGSGVPEPSQVAPPLPDNLASRAQPKISPIPPLPLSNVCKQADIEGLWKLSHVYEEPAGNETEAFNSNPVQYVYYKPDQVFGKYNGDGALTTPALIIDHIDKHATGLQQYLLQNSGIIYFYQDKVANDTQACFTVLKPKGPFVQGDMLLMPPKGQIAGRLIKQYTKVQTEPAVATPTATAPNSGDAPAPVINRYRPTRAGRSIPTDPNTQ